MTSNGYTARVARVIAASTGADVFEVETAEPYPAGLLEDGVAFTQMRA